jgi:hypothetical protein
MPIGKDGDEPTLRVPVCDADARESWRRPPMCAEELGEEIHQRVANAVH